MAVRVLILLAFLLATVQAYAACPPGTPADYPSPCYNNLTVDGTLGGAGTTARFSSPGPIGNGTPSTGAFSSLTVNGLPPVVYANVPTDGITPADAALKAAVDTCAATGATLYLPPGRILLSGAGAVSINLRQCALMGSNVPAAGTTVGSLGTVIYLTSTTTKPFILGSNWAIIGVNFFWPNQGGASPTVYPALFSDSGGEVNVGYMDNVHIINAYDVFVQTHNTSWGNIFITNSAFYAMHDAFALSNIGNSFIISNSDFSPAAWLTLCAFGTSCVQAINYASSNASMFHALAKSDSGPAGVALNITNITSFAWKYAFLLDATALVVSTVNMAGDAIGTIIDASSGGIWASQNILTGLMPYCNVIGWPSLTNNGNAPCFNMGANSALVLNGIVSNGGQGSFAVSTGSPITISNSSIGAIGGVVDGGDYYDIVTTGNGAIVATNNVFTGIPSSAHTHGIVTKTGASTIGATITGNQFNTMTESINMVATANTPTIIGNRSNYTQATTSMTLASGQSVMYRDNQFDKPPVVSISNCGTGGTLLAGGQLSGSIYVGSGASFGATPYCKINLPLNTPGNGACSFMPSIATSAGIGATVTGNPPVWSIYSSVDMSTTYLTYSCPGGLN